MEVSGQPYAPEALPPRKETPMPLGEEAGWTPETVWTRWRRKQIPASAGNRTPIVQPVGFQNEK